MIYTLENRAPTFLSPDYFVADSAAVIGRVTLHANASIWFNCVVRGDTDELIIGENSNVQDGSVLHTDPGIQLRIGRDCTIGHMVMLHGCEIGDNTLIGIGSVILNRARIGKGCLVGANTLITEGKEFPDNVMIMGSPGRIVRQLEPNQVAALSASAAHYVANWRRYRRELKPIAPLS